MTITLEQVINMAKQYAYYMDSTTYDDDHVKGWYQEVLEMERIDELPTREEKLKALGVEIK